MLDRDQLETFATIAELQSFEKAAAALHISRGAVSQRIRALEESLSSILLTRERPIALTPHGVALLRYVNAMRVLERSVLAEVLPSEDLQRQGPLPLVVGVNADSLATWFPPVLWQLMRRHPVTVEVLVDDQENTAERLARGEVMGCVSTQPKPLMGFAAEALGAMAYRCYATAEFKRRQFSQGLSLPAVLQAPAVVFDKADTLHDVFLKRLFGIAVERYPRHSVPSPQTLLAAVGEGVGYGLLPVAQVGGREPALSELAPAHPVEVPLYWHHWSAEPPLLAAISQAVIAHGRSALGGPSPPPAPG